MKTGGASTVQTPKDVQSAEKIALCGQEQASRKELDDARRANEQLQIRLQEACQHILSLTAQLPKIDQLKTKLKKGREQHAKSTDVWRATEKELRQTIADLTCRVSVLESEAAHRKTITETQEADLSSLEHTLTQRDGLIAELETALTDVTARVCLLEELRVVELTRFDQALQDANDKYTATIVALETAKAQVLRLDQSNRSMEMQLETSRRQMDAATTHHEHTQAALLHQLRHLHAEYAGAKRRSQAA